MSLESCGSFLKDFEQRFIHEFKNQVEFSLPIDRNKDKLEFNSF